MRIVDGVLVAVGLGGFVVCLRGFAGADAVNGILLTIALALAVICFAIGFKSVLDGMKSKGRTTIT